MSYPATWRKESLMPLTKEESSTFVLSRETSDLQLIELALAGEETAFEQIFTRYKKLVAIIASRYFHQSHQIEEVIQIVFVKAFFELGDFRGKHGFSLPSWLGRITTNVCLNILRSRKRKPENLYSDLSSDEIEYLRAKDKDEIKIWKPGDVKTTYVSNAAMAGKPGIYIVDNPKATQSVISIGQITGVERNNPDYFAIQVMNSILGGQFTSRLNMNLRENKGYTYGASSGWSFRRGGGAFTASANVQTAVTKEAVVEFIKELRGIGGEIPITPKELEYNKQSLIRRYPAGFETPSQIDSQLVNLDIYNLPNTYFNDYVSRINAVTIQDVNRVASKYLDPGKMAIVVVGDSKTIEKELKSLGLPMVFANMEGNPIIK